MRLAGGTILQAALVAAQPLLDLQQRLVRACIGVGRHGIGFQRHARIQMQHAVGAEAYLVLADRHMAGEIAVEILAKDVIGAIADALAQRLADTDAFARHSDRHVVSSLWMVVSSAGRPSLCPATSLCLATSQAWYNAGFKRWSTCSNRRNNHFVPRHALLVTTSLHR